MHVSRRQFLGSSAAAIIAAGTLARGKVFGANDRVRVACVGFHGRGRSHIEGFSKADGSEVVALCDVDKQVLEAAAQALKETTGKKPKTYTDMREVMADDSVDAVSFATPNHWHSLGAIWACQAKKDVYVEKPISHEVWEGRQVVAAAEKYGRIVQHGTQARSDAKWMRDMKKLRDGIIGEVYMARALCFKPRESIGFKEPKDPRPYLDWNLWQGPAQERQFCENYVHYNWHWFWDYGNGDIGNQGVHQMDIACWGLGKGLPVKVHSTGGRFGYKDQGETPNTLVATFNYGDGPILVFEVRGLYTNDEAGVGIGNLFYGSEGYYIGGKGFFDKKGNELPVGDEAPPTDGPFVNFLKAVRSRKPEDIHGSALDGHLAAAHCHLANISYRTGRSFEFDPTTETCKDPDAAALLKRKYREPFVVPQIA